MKKRARNRIIIWSAVSGVLIIALIFSYAIVGSFSYDLFADVFGLTSEYEALNESYGASKVKSITIDWPYGNVTIGNVANDSRLSVHEEFDGRYTDSPAATCTLGSNGELTINSNEEEEQLYVHLGAFSTGTKSLSVSIPNNADIKSIKVNTSSASIYFYGLTAGDIEATTASGGITIDNMLAENVTLQTVSGEVEATNVKCDSLSAETVSGGIMYNKIECPQVNTVSTSGEISASIKGDIKSVDTETVSGNIYLTFPEELKGITANYPDGDTSMWEFDGTYDGSTFKWGDGKAKMNINTVSGEVVLYRDKYINKVKKGDSIGKKFDDVDYMKILINEGYLSDNNSEWSDITFSGDDDEISYYDEVETENQKLIQKLIAKIESAKAVKDVYGARDDSVYDIEFGTFDEDAEDTVSIDEISCYKDYFTVNDSVTAYTYDGYSLESIKKLAEQIIAEEYDAEFSEEDWDE